MAPGRPPSPFLLGPLVGQPVLTSRLLVDQGPVSSIGHPVPNRVRLTVDENLF
jgi:hypothetical protein